MSNSKTIANRDNGKHRFSVESSAYPIFSRQATLSMDDNVTYLLGIDETLAAYVSDTAGLIAELDGTSKLYLYDPGHFIPDHVTYLDKSGRPCSWLVSMFWRVFATPWAPRPDCSFLNIDRRDWVRRSGAELFTSDYVRAPDGSNHRLSYEDFREDGITVEHLAWLRAQYVPGGIEREDAEYVMGRPTILDGKDICVVDEVSNSGATLRIAKYLLERAFPGSRVRGCHFWRKLAGVKPVSTDDGQMLNAPVWYDHHNQYGRGIGNVDADGSYWASVYKNNPTPENLARKFGAQALSRKINLARGGEDDRGTDRPTHQLIREMKRMRDDFETGRILFQPPQNYARDRAKEAILAQGLELGRTGAPDSYARICEEMAARRTRL